MSLLLHLEDGPLAGASLTVTTCPKRVRCVRSIAGKIDVLNLPEDEPAPDETVHWYEYDPDAPRGHVCTRGRGCFHSITLRHAPQLATLEDHRREHQLELGV